jgi:triphosphatase
MATEIELKLQLSPKAARKLGSHPLLEGIPSQKLHLLNTYFDTPTLELHARRVAVRFRKKGWQWLCTVKSAEPATGGLAMRSEWETPATPGTFDFSHVDADDFRDFLEQRSNRFEPVFTTDFHRQIWQVPFGESQIELALDRGQIESRGRRTPICEIELELLSGKVDDIFGLTRQLQEDIDLHPAIASKAERGYKLFLDEPLSPFKARLVAIDASQTPVEAFRTIALSCLEQFQRNEPGLLAGGEAEFIHQARVALRRLRSAIKLFAPVLPPRIRRCLWPDLADPGRLAGRCPQLGCFSGRNPATDCRGVSRKQGRQATAQGGASSRQMRPQIGDRPARRQRISAPAA